MDYLKDYGLQSKEFHAAIPGAAADMIRYHNKIKKEQKAALKDYGYLYKIIFRIFLLSFSS